MSRGHAVCGCVPRSLAGFLLVLLASFASIGQASQEGLALAQRVYDRPAGRDASSLVRMVVTSRKGQVRERELAVLARNVGGGERWTLMRFSLPTDVKDVGLLTMDHPGDASEQWLYLPALKRVRRISSTRKGGRFVGSDFSYEDLRDREPDMDTHVLAGTDKVGGLACTRLVSTPVDASNSVYTRRESCIHEATLVPLRVEFFEKDPQRPTKRLMARKLQKIQGYWTVLNATMYDLHAGSQTVLETLRIRYDNELPDALFSERALADPGMEKAYVLHAQ